MDSKEVGLTRRLLQTPLARPSSPGSSPASRPQQAASPSEDDRRSPGAVAAPSRARPGPSPSPGGASAGPTAPARARPGPGPTAPSSALRAPAPGPEGAGHQVLPMRGQGRGCGDPGRGHRNPRPQKRPNPRSRDTAPARFPWSAGSLQRAGLLRLSEALPGSPQRVPPPLPSLFSQTLGTPHQGLQDGILGMGCEVRQKEAATWRRQDFS